MCHIVLYCIALYRVKLDCVLFYCIALYYIVLCCRYALCVVYLEHYCTPIENYYPTIDSNTAMAYHFLNIL